MRLHCYYIIINIIISIIIIYVTSGKFPEDVVSVTWYGGEGWGDAVRAQPDHNVDDQAAHVQDPWGAFPQHGGSGASTMEHDEVSAPLLSYCHYSVKI